MKIKTKTFKRQYRITLHSKWVNIVSSLLRNPRKQGTWMTQLVGGLTPDFGSGPKLSAVRSRPAKGSNLRRESAWDSLPLPLPLPIPALLAYTLCLYLLKDLVFLSWLLLVLDWIHWNSAAESHICLYNLASFYQPGQRTRRWPLPYLFVF